MIGKTLQNGKYQIVRVLGQGGFGITYDGVQTGLNRRVAIKEFFMEDDCERNIETSYVSIVSTGKRHAQVENFKKKFVKEAQMIAGIEDIPHIIRIYDVFEENGTAYYVMQFIEGGSLQSLVKQKGKLDEIEATNFILQVAETLSALHKRHIMHLDIKPDNILLKDGKAILIDFGVSKQYDSEGNEKTSTPIPISKGYAPVEQYKGVTTFSPETDIYSLGATLYCLLTGVRPPDASDLISNKIELPSFIHADLKNAILHALQPNRDDRPHSIEEFLGYINKDILVPTINMSDNLDSRSDIKQENLQRSEVETGPSKPKQNNQNAKLSYCIIPDTKNNERTIIDSDKVKKPETHGGSDYHVANVFGDGELQLHSFCDKNNKWGYVNHHGEIVIPCQWDWCGEFCNGIAPICINEQILGIINASGNIINRINVEHIKSNRFFNSDAQARFWDSDIIGNLIIVSIGCSTKKIIIINNMTIDIIYTGFTPTFISSMESEGVLPVFNGLGENAIINIKGGKTIIENSFIFTGHFCCGMLLVHANGKYGFINKNGNLVVPCKWKNASDFFGGYARISEDNIKWGVVDVHGTIYYGNQWKYVSPFYNNLAVVQDENDMYGVINKNNELVQPCRWKDHPILGEDLIGVRKNKSMFGSRKWGHIKENDSPLLVAYKWTETSLFQNGWAKVKNKDDKWGIIDKKSNLVAECKWNDILLGRDVAFVKDNNNLWGMIDRKGVVLSKCQWKKILPLGSYSGLGSEERGYYVLFDIISLFRVEDTNNKWGCVNNNGNVILNCLYKRIKDSPKDFLGDGVDLSNKNSYCVICDDSDKWGLFDKQSYRILSPCKWNKIDFKLNEPWGYDGNTWKLIKTFF